ncbi:unnamed protein product [Aspergillus oryzae]|uniref:Unnamed protein product n=1 Tax=Aspergillus oryzae TaxID=5062 RepID=A0AAN4YVG2_ASPOZ|nr:unnamed protein product [Aspergillus oryzae]GMF85352.1 unnamed protein product [Aspergillus oryzae]GMG04291.1 unnamed protein product [Aspergillus oryzae]GMG37442.1 unnamed protein product [Aspergillus oryzae]
MDVLRTENKRLSDLFNLLRTENHRIEGENERLKAELEIMRKRWKDVLRVMSEMAQQDERTAGCRSSSSTTSPSSPTSPSGPCSQPSEEPKLDPKWKCVPRLLLDRIPSGLAKLKLRQLGLVVSAPPSKSATDSAPRIRMHEISTLGLVDLGALIRRRVSEKQTNYRREEAAKREKLIEQRKVQGEHHQHAFNKLCPCRREFQGSGSDQTQMSHRSRPTFLVTDDGATVCGTCSRLTPLNNLRTNQKTGETPSTLSAVSGRMDPFSPLDASWGPQVDSLVHYG